MQFTIERTVFLKALGHVQSVVEKRNTIPILSNILVCAEEDRLRLTATDMDVEIIDTVPARIGEEGAVTVAAHTLYDIVKKLPEGTDVEISLSEDGRLHLKAGRSRFHLPILPADDFPLFSDDDFVCSFSLSRGDIKRLIDKTRFSVSNEETRYYLNGIHFHVTEDKNYLRSVATDGHRLAQAQMARPEGTDNMPAIIVARKTIDQIYRLIDSSDEVVSLDISESKIRFSHGNTLLTSKLVDGVFPDYERVIPKNNQKVMKVDNSLLREAVDRVATVSSEKSRFVKMSLTQDKLELSVQQAESGEASEELGADYTEEAMEIGFNARYVLEVAAQIEGAEAEFYFDAATSPTLMRDSGDEHVLYVLMPLRV